MEVKPGYKQSEVGVIPEDWAVKRLGELADIETGLSKPKIVFGSGCPVVMVQNLYEGSRINVAGLRRVVATDDEIRKYRLERGDVLIGNASVQRDGIGYANQFDGASEDIIFAKYLYRASNLRQVRPLFLLHYLRAEGCRNRIISSSQTGTLTNLNKASAAAIPISLPPTEVEQKRIEEVLSDTDTLVESIENLIAKNRDLKQAAMQQLLTGQKRLPGFHGEWGRKELGKLGQISGAGVDKKIRPDEPSVRLVNYMDVYRRNFIYSKDLNHVVSARPEQANRCAVKRGDVFFTPSSEMPFDIAVSAVAMEDILDAAYSYHVVRLRLDEDWDLLFRAYAFKSQEFLNQAARACEGSGVRYVITQGKFRQLSVRFPPLKEEQTAIAEVLSDMDAELAALTQRRDKTRALKQGMMQELLTGRIRLI